MKKNGIIKRLGRKGKVMEEKKNEYCIISEGIRGSRTKKLGKEGGRGEEGEEKRRLQRAREGGKEGTEDNLSSWWLKLVELLAVIPGPHPSHLAFPGDTHITAPLAPLDTLPPPPCLSSHPCLCCHP